MGTKEKEDGLVKMLEAILSKEELSVNNVIKFLDEGKIALEELLKIGQKKANELLDKFNQCEQKVKDWKNKSIVKDEFKNVGCILEEKDTPTGYKLFKHTNESNDDLKKINKFITYCDRHGDGIGTEGYNETGIVMELAYVYQDAWVKNLLKYIIDKQDKNIDNRVIRAIKYFQEPDKYLSIISENHLDLISQYYLGYKANDADLITYFNEKFKDKIKNEYVQEYKNKLYTDILYYKTEKENWQSKAIVKGVKDLLDNHYNIILTGAPGTGKTYLAKESLVKFNDLTPNGNFSKERVQFVQFHPTYDYTDFVEGLRPISDSNKNIVFERKDGIFKRFCKCAILGLPVNATDGEIKKEEETLENQKGQEGKIETGQKYLFIIDEINRGDISKIFGELFFAIDSGYRGERGRVDTQYQNLVSKEDDDIFKDGFYIPDNVYIIGTMNDIDRSVESLDFAFRRRFAFQEILVKDTQEAILYSIDEELRKKLISKMNKLNDKLGKLGLNEAYYIGAAYFKKIEKYSAYNKSDIQFKKLWEDHLKGVLYEYFRGEVDADKKLTELKEVYDNA